jgi:hypothetical protein
MRQTSLTAIASATLLALTGCGGGGSSPTTPQPLPPTNLAPVFSSPTTASVPENSSGTIYTATATDPENSAVSFTIAGGADAARFALGAGGALSFIAPPDFETPTDANRDNVYQVQLSASDGSASATLTLAVTVTDRTDGAFRVRRVATGFAQPLYLAPVPDTTGRVFVVEQGASAFSIQQRAQSRPRHSLMFRPAFQPGANAACWALSPHPISRRVAQSISMSPIRQAILKYGDTAQKQAIVT